MHIWSVGLSDDLSSIFGAQQAKSTLFRHFQNGLDLIAALRENTCGRLAIILKLRLPILDGLGVIRLLQQEGLLDQHHFILSAPHLSASEEEQLAAWKVEMVRPGILPPSIAESLHLGASIPSGSAVI